MLYLLIVIFCLALSYVLFLPSLKLSWALGAVDYPNARKIHASPTARAGGFSFFAAFLMPLLVSSADFSFKIPLAVGSTLIFLLGFLDDTLNLSPFVKLSGQFLALAVYHFLSEILGIGASPLLSMLISVWIIFITNATNIIDGLDGLCGGVCASQALCLAVASLLLRSPTALLCSLLLLGAILGFLPRNFPKAKIFMGDCGSLFLGFALACISGRLFTDNPSIICTLSILLIFRVPSYEAAFSLARRLLRGKNPFRADKGHFHHRLLRLGFSRECAALVLITLSLAFGLFGILIAVI